MGETKQICALSVGKIWFYGMRRTAAELLLIAIIRCK